jgi:hypothetical protein
MIDCAHNKRASAQAIGAHVLLQAQTRSSGGRFLVFPDTAFLAKIVDSGIAVGCFYAQCQYDYVSGLARAYG